MHDLEGAQCIARLVIFSALLRGHVCGIVEEGSLVINDADREAECMVDLSHPHTVAAREVVVDGDDLHTPPRERVEIGGERGDKRFSLARAHLCDAALVQDHAADELYVEMALAKRATRCFTHRGERFRRKLVEHCLFRRSAGKSLRQSLPKFDSLFFQSRVRERFHSLLVRIGLCNNRLRAFQSGRAFIAKYRFPKGHNPVSTGHPTSNDLFLRPSVSDQNFLGAVAS